MIPYRELLPGLGVTAIAIMLILIGIALRGAWIVLRERDKWIRKGYQEGWSDRSAAGFAKRERR